MRVARQRSQTDAHRILVGGLDRGARRASRLYDRRSSHGVHWTAEHDQTVGYSVLHRLGADGHLDQCVHAAGRSHPHRFGHGGRH